jgi:hypothetical protein
MLSAKEATKIAVEYFKDFYSDYDYKEIRIEEVELDGSLWFITIGYLDQLTGDSTFGIKMHQRRFKLFGIHANTGEVKSMKIRKAE